MSDEEQLEFEHLLVETKGAVATITINRPKQLNALNENVLFELEEAIFEQLDPEVIRVIVLCGSGDKAFVAGADIEEMRDLGPEQALAFARQGQALTRALETLPQIVIAKVQGFALGGGCELAMACDLIIASEKAKFGQPEVGLGLVPGFGGTQRLVRRVGLPVALDILCTGKQRTLSGAEAFSLGLVSRVVPHEELNQEVERVVSAILKNGPEAVGEVKRLCRESYNMSLEAGLSSEASSFSNCFAREEAQIGLNAFLNKSDPGFDKL